jgi:hypothetical protein
MVEQVALRLASAPRRGVERKVVGQMTPLAPSPQVGRIAVFPKSEAKITALSQRFPARVMVSARRAFQLAG